MKISIVVPVYNIQEYIGKCIESIISQNHENYELILVDDGSTDDSGKICDKYLSKHSNVKVIHKVNGGLSDARNEGIRAATGDYIMFVDGDDYLKHNNCLQILAEKVKYGQTDIIQYKMIHYYDYNNKYIQLNDFKVEDCKDTLGIIKKTISDGSFSPSACDKLIKLSIIKENNLYFEKGLLSEDIKWSLNLFLHVKNMNVINEDIYVYRRQRQGSITTNISNKNVLSILNIINYWLNYKFENQQYKDIYLSYMAYQYVILLTIMNNKNTNKDDRKLIYALRSILQYDLNFKVKMSNKIFKLLGIKLGRNVLKVYNNLKNRGLIKI